MANDEDTEIDLLELFAVFYQKKFRILFSAIIGAMLGFGIARLAVPIYSADALIQIEKKSNGGLALSADLTSMFSQKPETLVEMEILKSRMILGKVVKDLALDVTATPKRLPIVGNMLTRYNFAKPNVALLSSYGWHDEAIKIHNLVVPDALLDQKLVLTYGGGDAFQINLGGGRILDGKIGAVLARPKLGFSVVVDSIIGHKGTQYILEKTNFADAIGALRKRLSVSEKGNKSSILQMAITGRDPARAALILGKISDFYLLQNLSRNSAEAESSLSFIQKQLPEAEANMHNAETAINQYKLSRDSVDLTFETKSLLEKSVQIEAKLNELRLQEQELQKRFTPSHPVYQTLLENRAQLETELEDIRTQSASLPQTQLEMLRLTQNMEVARKIYLQLVTRSQELGVIKAGTIGNIRIIDTPLPSPKPIKPNTQLYVALAGILALLLAMAVVFLKSMLNKKIESQAMLEALGLTVFGTVQKVGDGNYAGSGRRKNLKILAKQEPTNLAVEALRSLRTSLHFGLLDAKSNIIALTSARPGEGKSFIAVNLATVIAQAGQNTCLIDTDLRRGYLRRYFGVAKSEPGLSDVLAGTVSLEDVLKTDPDTGLHFIPTGKYPPNPSELFMHKNFATLCDDLGARFDTVIMDAPPLLAVTDPVIIGKYVGMILMVIRHKLTLEGEAAAALKVLQNSGLKAGGAVLNNYDPKAAKAGTNEYSYQYSYKSRD